MRLVALFAVMFSGNAIAQFSPAGQLVAGSGTGRVDARVWAPDIRFPIQSAPAYANSQVWGVGGYRGPSGGQCDTRNYSFPWHDNYCESRRWTMPLCPAGRGHQGQDIRPATCDDGVHPAVAAVAGTITNVGRYSVYLTAEDGTRFDYLHMSDVQVRTGDEVECGEVLGMVSNRFNGTPTTIHLHFNIRQAVAGVGTLFVPPYTSLVEAYERLGEGERCEPGGMPDAAMPDAMPDAGGSSRTCFSTTVGRDIASGACVQVEGGACGTADCGIWQCVDGYWACPDVGACAETFEHDACIEAPAPAPGRDDTQCRSTILGRNVDSGTCVQVDGSHRDGEPAECSEGCGWYRCVDGRWACSRSSDCTSEQHRNPACVPTGASCDSVTIGETVNHTDCVQIAGEGCGVDSCAWYRCSDGAWTCHDVDDCEGVTHHHSVCRPADSCGAQTTCADCALESDCGWCVAESRCVSPEASGGCGGFWDTPSACEDCSATDCTTCATSGYCVWCPGVGCVNQSIPDEFARCGPDFAANPSDCGGT